MFIFDRLASRRSCSRIEAGGSADAEPVERVVCQTAVESGNPGANSERLDDQRTGSQTGARVGRTLSQNMSRTPDPRFKPTSTTRKRVVNRHRVVVAASPAFQSRLDRFCELVLLSAPLLISDIARLRQSLRSYPSNSHLACPSRKGCVDDRCWSRSVGFV